MSGTRVAALSVLFLLPATLSSAQAPVVQKPLPPIVRKFIAAVRQAQTLSVEMTQTYHFKSVSKPDVVTAAALSLEKPNKVALACTTGSTTVVSASSDGLVVSEWDATQTSRQPAPRTLEEMLARLRNGLLLHRPDAVAASVGFVLFTHPDALAALPNLQKAGQESIDGVQTHEVVAFVSDEPNGLPLMQTATGKTSFWFAADTGLPVQVVISDEAETFTIRFSHYKIDKPVPGAVFAAAPPGRITGMPTRHGALNFLKTGSPAPDFTLGALDSQPRTLSALKGRVVLLAFCPSWLPAGFTDTSLSLIQEAQAAMSAKGLTILWVVATDKPYVVAAFAKTHTQVPMTVLLDPPPWPQSVEQKLYHVQATPTFYVINRKGQVIAGFLGSLPNKQAIIQSDTRAAAVSALMHGRGLPDAPSPYDQAEDMMDEASLQAALTTAGLTKSGGLQ